MSAGRRVERAARDVLLAAAPLLVGRGPGGGGRIAAIRQDDRLGNVVLITPFLRRLHEAFPALAIDAIVSDRYHRLLDGFPGIGEVVVVRKEEAKRRPWTYPAFLRSLGRRGYEMAFDLSDENSFSLSAALTVLATRAPVRVGFDNPRAGRYLTHRVPPPRAPRYAGHTPLLLLGALGAAAAPADPALSLPGEPEPVRAFIAGARAGGRAVVGVNLGGRGRKRWPAASARRCVERLVSDPRLRVVIVWGPSERGIASEFADLAGRGVLRAPLLPEDDLGRLLRGLDLFITPDTGAMHVAAAVGTPVVAIFLHSDPVKYGPRGGRHRVLGGFGESVEAERVVEAALEALGGAGSGAAGGGAVARPAERRA
jgi:heptosyltransferase-3